jgi:competence protein ComEC
MDVTFRSELPFVRLLIPLLAGILLAHSGMKPDYLLFFAVMTVFTGLLISRTGREYRYRWISGILIFSAMIAFGCLRYAQAYQQPQLITGKYCTYIATRDGNMRKKWQSVAALDQRGNQVHLNLLGSSQLISEGALLVAKDNRKEPRGPKQINDFDYRQYLRYQGVWLESWLTNGDYRLIHPGSPGFTSMSFRYLDSLLCSQLASTSLEVARAMVLGEKRTLDSKTRDLFVKSGAMHVLAVSGLHVGIVYLLLSLLLGKSRAATVIIILLIWCYAALTGFSPSVQRAALMFSIIAFGSAGRFSHNMWNTLGAAAFILLTLKPLLLFQAGFQLSFAAVAGIMHGYQPVSQLFKFRSKILKWVWSLTAVSICAQISTLPFVLYHFGSLPVYALVSNLFVVPAATGILFGAAALFILSSFGLSWVSWIGWLLDLCIEWTLHGLAWVSGLPYAQLHMEAGIGECTILAMIIILIARRL